MQNKNQKELWQMTYKQFYNYRINKMYQDNKPHVTKMECIELYPLENIQLKDEYYNLIIDAVREGNRIPNIILDQNERIRYRVLHDYNNHNEYADYMPPEIRELNKHNKIGLKRPGRPRKDNNKQPKYYFEIINGKAFKINL